MLLGLAHFRVTDTARNVLAGIPITVRWTMPLTRAEVESTVVSDKDGNAIVAVPAAQMPQISIDAEFVAKSTHGKVKVGGNSATPLTEIMVNAA